MTTVFLDECGYTGDDLLCPKQPVFVVATVSLGEDTSAEMKREYFGNVQARELKHVALAKRDRQKQMILNFLGDGRLVPEVVKVAVSHKRFALLVHIVERLVSPVFSDVGADLYEFGGHVALANELFRHLHAEQAVSYGQNVLKSYQDFAREGGWRMYELFRMAVSATNYPTEFREAFSILENCVECLPYHRAEVGRHGLDLSVSMAFAVMARWAAQNRQPVALIHDRSSSMLRDSELWNAAVDPANPSMKGSVWEHFDLEYPAISSTQFESSALYSGLQLADVIAGAVAHTYNWSNGAQDPGDWYGAEVTSYLRRKPLVAHSLWPGHEVTPQEVGFGSHVRDHSAHFHQLLERHGLLFS